jgi:4'-phosphopantetheinyl transferase
MQNFTIDKNEVHIWQFEWETLTTKNLQYLLSNDEQTQMDKYKVHDDRMRFCIGRAMLRFLSGRYLNIDSRLQLSVSDMGKPYWQQYNDRLSFNISHSGQWVIIAFTSGREIGIDVEAINNSAKFDFRNIAKHSFHKDEIAAIDTSSTPRDIFYDIWSCKEAVIKALGIGLHCDLQKLSVLPLPALNQWSEITYKNDSVTISKFAVDNNYTSAVAIMGNNPVTQIKFMTMDDFGFLK